jgi:CBS domain-containing protein
MKHQFVKDLMTTPAITCDYSTSIKDVISIMKQNNIGFVPITKSEIIVGVVTDRDILIRGIGIYKLNTKINKIMTAGEIHFTNPSTHLIDAAKIMSKNKIRRLVVLNDGKVEGVLTTKNLLKETSMATYIADTYLEDKTLSHYSIYSNSNPHDSLKASDYPL